MKAMLLLLGLMGGIVLGDGISMTKDHRFEYERESCYTMKLTSEQMAALEEQREGTKTLYADMKLTEEQVAFLKGKTGKVIREVLVFEDGWQDCGCCTTNIASRFVPDQIEVSDSYLMDEEVLRKRDERWKAIEIEQAEKRAAEAKAEAAKAGTEQKD